MLFARSNCETYKGRPCDLGQSSEWCFPSSALLFENFHGQARKRVNREKECVTAGAQ